jgi:hypothetical protein
MELPVTLRSSRKKMLLMLVGSLMFVAAGFWMLDDHPVSGYASIIFFGLCAVVFCINLFPNSSYLRLTREGFTMCSMFRCRSIEWRHVSHFGISRIGLKKLVGWDPSHPVSSAGKATKAISGYVSALPDTYSLTPEELAELMNKAREQATGHETI